MNTDRIPPIVVAIDGYSSTGKSTVAKGLAARLKLVYIDSGAMYRAVAFFALHNELVNNGIVNIDGLKQALTNISIRFEFDNETATSKTLLNGRDVENHIRTPEVAAIVSEVAAIPEVRRRLVDFQRTMGEQGGLVMDGRDIGTVVFPNADVKLFMTAREAIRVERRYREMVQKGDKNATIENVRNNLHHRDHIDTTREDSPLVKADDATVLDNSTMSIEEQLDWAVAHIMRVIS